MKPYLIATSVLYIWICLSSAVNVPFACEDGTCLDVPTTAYDLVVERWWGNGGAPAFEPFSICAVRQDGFLICFDTNGNERELPYGIGGFVDARKVYGLDGAYSLTKCRITSSQSLACSVGLTDTGVESFAVSATSATYGLCGNSNMFGMCVVKNGGNLTCNDINHVMEFVGQTRPPPPELATGAKQIFAGAYGTYCVLKEDSTLGCFGWSKPTTVVPLPASFSSGITSVAVAYGGTGCGSITTAVCATYRDGSLQCAILAADVKLVDSYVFHEPYILGSHPLLVAPPGSVEGAMAVQFTGALTASGPPGDVLDTESYLVCASNGSAKAMPCWLLHVPPHARSEFVEWRFLGNATTISSGLELQLPPQQPPHGLSHDAVTGTAAAFSGEDVGDTQDKAGKPGEPPMVVKLGIERKEDEAMVLVACTVAASGVLSCAPYPQANLNSSAPAINPPTPLPVPAKAQTLSVLQSGCLDFCLSCGEGGKCTACTPGYAPDPADGGRCAPDPRGVCTQAYADKPDSEQCTCLPGYSAKENNGECLPCKDAACESCRGVDNSLCEKCIDTHRLAEDGSCQPLQFFCAEDRYPFSCTNNSRCIDRSWVTRGETKGCLSRTDCEVAYQSCIDDTMPAVPHGAGSSEGGAPQQVVGPAGPGQQPVVSNSYQTGCADCCLRIDEVGGKTWFLLHWLNGSYMQCDPPRSTRIGRPAGKGGKPAAKGDKKKKRG